MWRKVVLGGLGVVEAALAIIRPHTGSKLIQHLSNGFVHIPCPLNVGVFCVLTIEYKSTLDYKVVANRLIFYKMYAMDRI